MSYALPALPYKYDALEPNYSADVLELHHDKHHAAYVAGANRALEQIEGARVAGAYGTINALERDLAFHVSGHVLHSMFWTNMTADSRGAPEGDLAAAIAEAFGAFEQLRVLMAHAAVQLQGSGWAALAWEPNAGRLLVEQIHDHQDNAITGSVPLLVIDVWEHAYYLQYRNQRAAFVDAFWEIANWADVASRLERARGQAVAAS